MDEARVLTRLGRIDALDRSGAAPGELLAELRCLLREAEEQAGEHAAAARHEEEVDGRLGTAQQGT
jgi:hypothetical protein